MSKAKLKWNIGTSSLACGSWCGTELFSGFGILVVVYRQMLARRNWITGAVLENYVLRREDVKLS